MGLDNGIKVKGITKEDRLKYGISIPYNETDDDICYWRKCWNMTQVDNTERTKLVYEEVLKDFTSLNGLKVDGIDMNLVDLFYLYNLIVNKDEWNDNDCIWEYKDMVPTILRNILDLDRLIFYLKDHPDAEISFYDSY